MYLPPIKAQGPSKIQCKSFMGYNEREKIDDVQFSIMRNMSGDLIPCATPRKSREIIKSISDIKTIFSPQYKNGDLTGFSGVAGTNFWYNDTIISGKPLTTGEKSIVDFNGKICIFPDKLYYNYLKDSETGVVINSLQDMEKSLSLAGVKFYSYSDKVTGETESYIQKTDANFDKNFKVGDSLVITGCTNGIENNTFVVDSKTKFAAAEKIISVIVESVENNKLTLRLYNKNGAVAKFKNITESATVNISVYIPNMSHVCVHGNRLWGTSDNGEFVYASKLGDCFNFNSFQGLADDSWYGTIATDGEFTGIIGFRNAVVAFKRNHIHHIYGDSPQNFSIPKQTNGGTLDGKSLSEIGGVLYYLAGNGFFAYTGGQPEKISDNILEKYISCCGGTDGVKYYACAEKADHTFDVLVYTPQYRMWHKEDNLHFVGFIEYNGKLYGATRTEVLKFESGSEVVSWSMASKKFTLDSMEHKGVNDIFIRINLNSGSNVKIYFSKDDGEFKKCGELSKSGYFVHKIPVRFVKCDSFRVKIEGTGNAVLHDIEVVQYIGGKNNGKY
ncbi:MAG: hypothetical protein RSC29_00725 [Oscillospiraceae bacterium]